MLNFTSAMFLINFFFVFGTRYKSVIIGEGDNNMYAIMVCI